MTRTAAMRPAGRLGLVLATVLALIVAPLAWPSTAKAATDFDHKGAITDLEITAESDQIYAMDTQLTIKGNWSVPNGAQAGETFGLTLPKQFTTMDAFNLTSPEGDVVANCVASDPESSDVGPEVVCTLTDFVNGKEDVGGQITFRTTAKEELNETTVTFIVDDEERIVNLPGGGTGTILPRPREQTGDEPEKNSWSEGTDSDKTLHWQVRVPAMEARTVTVTDKLSPAGGEYKGHSLVEGSVEVIRYDLENGEVVRGTEFRPDSQITVDDDLQGFTATFDIEPGYEYRVLYVTQSDEGYEEGFTFHNVATIDGKDYDKSFTYYSSGGGTGDGNEPTPTPTPDESPTPEESPSTEQPPSEDDSPSPKPSPSNRQAG